MTPDHPRIRIDVHGNGGTSEECLEEIRKALLSSPRRLPTKYLYDDQGSALFEHICQLPEYYQTRTERQILAKSADEIVAHTRARELVELGSGAATKTRLLLNAMARANQLHRYIPFDVSEGIVRRVAQELIQEYESLEVYGVVGDFLTHLEHIPPGGRRLVAFLGGTIGNLQPEEAQAFLRSVHQEMAPGDFFLLGVQLITDTGRLEAAYNDRAGVTAAFNQNILRVMRAVAGADFHPEQFAHVARYNARQHRIEMSLRSLRDQDVRLTELDLTIHFARGEEILTEISTKYNRHHVEALLQSAGFVPVAWHTDPEHLHGLALARKP
ncbi:MAG: L-histidine N(alpha)-methyltransferase [Nitrospirae bacterium]|nr:MAG: L-histidine N(alpha)-methyltransferase [Nitrospirota bacterium]